MIYAYCGKLGAGKSFTQLEHVIQLAEKQNRHIVSNVPLNMDVVYRYCLTKGYHRVAAKLRRGWFFVESDFNRIMSYENAVILADELGIFMNSRATIGSGFEKNKKFFFDLILSRKAGLDLCWVAQDMEMVDVNIRRLTNVYYHTWNTHPNKKPNPFRRRFIGQFDAVGYAKWLQNRSVKSFWHHKLGWELKPFDPLLFKAYDTLYRLDKSKTYALEEVAFEVAKLDGEPGDVKQLHPIEIPDSYVPGQVWRPA